MCIRDRNTPASAIVDAMGRTIAAIERNRAKNDPGNPLLPIEEYLTRSTYDIQGNLLNVTDALNRLAFTHFYDLIKRPLRVDSIDEEHAFLYLTPWAILLSKSTAKELLSFAPTTY